MCVVGVPNFSNSTISLKVRIRGKTWGMVFGVLLSGQDGVPIENVWDRVYEGYLTLSASTHHYRMLKKWAIVDRNGVYGLLGHVKRNRHVDTHTKD